MPSEFDCYRITQLVTATLRTFRRPTQRNQRNFRGGGPQSAPQASADLSANQAAPTAPLNSGINEELQAGFSGGNVYVFSAGDANVSSTTQSSACNQSYPSNRPEVIAVNGFKTRYTSTGALQSNPVLEPGAWSTSGCTIGVYNGSSYSSRADNSIGALAGGDASMNYYWNSSSDFGYRDATWVGSSFSAPMVAGVAGLLRNAWYEGGYGVRPNYLLKSDILMLTDGYSFLGNPDSGTGRLTGGTSKFSGTGRLQARVPVFGFTAAWSWAGSVSTLSNGQTVSETPVPATFTSYRMGMYWEETDLAHAADIDVTVDALNSSGVVCAAGFASQTDYSIENAIHLQSTDIPTCALSGGSVRINYHAYAIPSGQTRQLFASSLWDHEGGY